MISPFCTDDELIRATALVRSPVVRIVAERLTQRLKQIRTARAILTAPADPQDAIRAALDALGE